MVTHSTQKRKSATEPVLHETAQKRLVEIRHELRKLDQETLKILVRATDKQSVRTIKQTLKRIRAL